MGLGIAMLVSYLPFFAWVISEGRRQSAESKRTH